MTQKEMILVLSYFYNNKVRLEREVQQRQSNLRFRDVDIVDCMELACAIQQLQTFNEVSNHVRLLLKLKGGKL